MSPRVRLAAVALVIGGAFSLTALLLPHSPEELRETVAAQGVVAPLLLVLAWVVLTPALFSGTILAVVSGLALGVPLGGAAGLIGATLGGLVAYGIARRCGAEAVHEMSGRRLRDVQARIERRGFAAVLCARLAPGVPATLLNYACGLARVRPRHFAAGSAIGAAPRVFAYSALGASGGDLSSPAAIGGLAVIGVLTLAALVLALARRRLRSQSARLCGAGAGRSGWT